MTTFNVDKVGVNTPEQSVHGSKKWHEHYFRQELGRVGIKSTEAYKLNTPEDHPYKLHRPDINSFLHTCLNAYNDHVPLTFAPDDIWVVCVQAVTKHIEQDPEAVRKALVQFEGKQALHIRADDFQKGSSDNNWERVFGQFGDQMEKYLGKKRELFDPTFSTTTLTEKAVIQTQMMAALAPYFEYRMSTMCGIPNITLLGTEEDWDALLTRVTAFAEFMPLWAHNPMMRVVSEFALAKKGQVTLEFWQNFVKQSGGSGGPYVSGYINGLFPYLDKYKNSQLVDRDGTPCFERKMATPKSHFGGANQSSFPSSISSVPIIWNYYGTEYQMTLATGIFGTAVYGASYRPVMGWAIGDARERMSDEEINKVRLEAYKNKVADFHE